ALITVSRTASGAGASRDAELLEELLPPLLADEPQGEGDQAGHDREDERDAREGARSADRAGGLDLRRGSVVRRGSDKTAGAGRNHEERADRGEGHREAEDERDRDALRMQDLAALVREFVVDPL